MARVVQFVPGIISTIELPYEVGKSVKFNQLFENLRANSEFAAVSTVVSSPDNAKGSNIPTAEIGNARRRSYYDNIVEKLERKYGSHVLGAEDEHNSEISGSSSQDDGSDNEMSDSEAKPSDDQVESNEKCKDANKKEKSRKKRKIVEYYDETDGFIDDSEAFQEVEHALVMKKKTKHSGFFVYSGDKVLENAEECEEVVQVVSSQLSQPSSQLNLPPTTPVVNVLPAATVRKKKNADGVAVSSETAPVKDSVDEGHVSGDAATSYTPPVELSVILAELKIKIDELQQSGVKITKLAIPWQFDDILLDFDKRFIKAVCLILSVDCPNTQFLDCSMVIGGNTLNIPVHIMSKVTNKLWKSKIEPFYHQAIASYMEHGVTAGKIKNTLKRIRSKYRSTLIATDIMRDIKVLTGLVARAIVLYMPPARLSHSAKLAVGQVDNSVEDESAQPIDEGMNDVMHNSQIDDGPIENIATGESVKWKVKWSQAMKMIFFGLESKLLIWHHVNSQYCSELSVEDRKQSHHISDMLSPNIIIDDTVFVADQVEINSVYPGIVIKALSGFTEHKNPSNNEMEKCIGCDIIHIKRMIAAEKQRLKRKAKATEASINVVHHAPSPGVVTCNPSVVVTSPSPASAAVMSLPSPSRGLLSDGRIAI